MTAREASTVQHTARLHETAVQAVAAGRVQAYRRGRRKPSERHTGPTKGVTAVVVDPRVWPVALRLAAGEAQRIEVRTPTDVVVHNHTNWRRK